MLDLESLFSSLPPPATVFGSDLSPGQARHSGHNGNTPYFDQVCLPNPLQHKAFSVIDTADTADTVHFQGGEDGQDQRAPDGGAAVSYFALHPAAVILALAWCRKVRAANDERAAVLLHLQTMTPGQQVRHWHLLCLEAGLKPWEELLIPAPASGLDCTMCKHLTTRQMTGESGRREFHTACGLGFLILETGRGTERIWIAPPDCKSYERWRPGLQTSAPITYRADLLAGG